MRPELPTAALRSSQATHAALDNSAPLQPARSIFISWGKTVQTSGATSGYRPRGMYFEDFEVGQSIVTSRRTVTQTDIVNFACLSGDHNAPHIDHEFCKTQPYGEPIAHGPLVLAMVGGLQCLSGINDGTIIAMMGLDQWRMHLPVKAGDTIYAVITPKEKKTYQQRYERHRDM